MAIIAARTRVWSPVAHAVEDDGALCGARPRGHWTLSQRVPINCPACLLEMSAQRWAYCETPTATSMTRLHIRQLGPDGMHRGGIGRPSLTLCGRPAGWDVRMVAGLDGDDDSVCAACRVLYRGRTTKAPLRVVRGG